MSYKQASLAYIGLSETFWTWRYRWKLQRLSSERQKEGEFIKHASVTGMKKKENYQFLSINHLLLDILQLRPFFFLKKNSSSF